MVLAAGLGTRLRPLTYQLPKPMVPVLNRPVMAHAVELLRRHGFNEIIANLHYFPDTIRDYFGDQVTYSYEEELLGTAGGVRNCREFFGDQPFLIISGDALTDTDLTALYERHVSAGGVATLTVKKVSDPREFGVVLHDSEGRIYGFQEKPEPDEALSNLANCGIYMFSPEIFDYFPDRPFVDWAQDVFPTLLEGDIPFYIHETDQYWNDVGSLSELRQGTFDAITGKLQLDIGGEERQEGVIVGAGTQLPSSELVQAPIWVGENVTIGQDVRLDGPLVIGDNVTIGSGAALKGSIILPGSKIASDTVVIEAIIGDRDICSNLRPIAP